jgi:CRISPR-associated protein Cas1
MKKNYHLFSSGELKRSENTLRFDSDEDETSHIPVEDVESVYCHGQIRINTKLLDFARQHNIQIHCFGYSGQYSGSFIPPKSHTSGSTVVEQVSSYKNSTKRLVIARQIVKSSIHNMRKNLKYYEQKADTTDSIRELESISESILSLDDIDDLRGYEAQARKRYYDNFDNIIDSDSMIFNKRTYNPPKNEVNALISYLNSLTYSSITSAIRSTALDPTISYLHEPGDRRNSLSLDIGDIFKPVIADRIAFRLLNRNQISNDDFTDTYQLNESPRKLVVKEFEEMMEETVDHPKLKRHVSYQYLLRLDAYKLKKHILTGESYEPFKRWW